MHYFMCYQQSVDDTNTAVCWQKYL